MPRDAFIQAHLVEHNPSYEAYLHELFNTALSLMLPSEKYDLGKHCFGYASILANEFYFTDKPLDGLRLCSRESSGAEDRLAYACQEIDADWAAVEKDWQGRVSLDAFVNYFLAKHGDKMELQTQCAYQDFLVQNFRSALAMMLPACNSNLGEHCFRYAPHGR